MIALSKPCFSQQQAPQQTQAQTQQAEKLPAYSLPPDKLAKAVAFSRLRVTLGLAGSVWGILQLLLLLAVGAVGWMQRTAIRTSRNRWAQGFLFVFLLMLATTLLSLPLDLAGHHFSRVYGISVQGWGSWFWDMTKSFLISFVFGGLVMMLLFWVIRKSPRRWWFWFWIPAVALVVLMVFVAPVILDPLFNKFEPLAKSNPALVDRLEQMTHRGGINIPPERMFLMKASEKVTVLNAYVTGIGASKRVVVWDNSIERATPDQISFIFGHEMGHYVLNHIPKTLVFLSLLLLVEFYIGFRGMQWLLRRYGARWGIGSQNDWGSVVVLMLVISVLSFVTQPVMNAYSRSHEHIADIYGQESVHGIVADPQATAVGTFQLLGEMGLEEPQPNRYIEFWLFSHPSITHRVAFAAAYDPWVAGGHPQYFQK